jgi:hypothetical protein
LVGENVVVRPENVVFYVADAVLREVDHGLLKLVHAQP